MKALVASVSLVVASLTGHAAAQLVVGNSQAVADHPTLWLIDVSGAHPPRELASGNVAVGTVDVNAGVAWGAAADESAQLLYWNNNTVLFSAPYTTSGTLDPSGIVMTLAGTNPPATTSMTGLAFDTHEHALYGFKNMSTTTEAAFYPVGLYQIDTITGQCTLVFATTGADYGGFDYDDDTDAFYGLNDSSLAIGPGRGLIRLDKPLSSGVANRIGLYPPGDLDIDGLAVGGGRAYFVNDIPAEGIPVFSLSSGVMVDFVSSPFTASTGTFSAGAWAPGLIKRTPVCGTSDFNGDGDFGTDGDIEAFFACLSGNCCPACFEGGADFDLDGDTGTDADIEKFFRVLGGGAC